MKSLSKKSTAIILTMLFAVSNTSILAGAEGYVDTVIQADNEAIEPYYEIMQQPYVSIDGNSVYTFLETYKYASLKINLKVYEEKGNSWALLVNKTFTGNGYRVSGTANCNFQSGKEYRIVADFYADDEYDQIEQYYMA